MKRFAHFALLLATTITAAQISTSRNQLSENPLYRNLMRSSSDPATACEGATGPRPHPDPDDCTQFYFCTGPGVANPSTPIACGDEYKCFDPRFSDCSDDADACITACETNGPSCNEECGGPGQQVSHPTDCNIRYICDANSKPVELHCFDAARPFFNGYECVADEAQCCTCRTRTCTGGSIGDLLVDPEDCHSFYICIGNPLEPIGPQKCPSGGVFNPTTKRCDSSSTTCSNSCNIDGGNPSSSTTGSPSASTTTPSATDCTDIASFTCPGNGFYARCSFCDPSFFSCDRAGGTPTQGACSGNLVFNPTPEYPYCVLPDNCPIS